MISQAIDWTLVAVLTICVFVWPTQWITDNLNRWLRIVAVSLAVGQIVVQGLRIELVGAYLVAALFAVLLIARRGGEEPSAIRESKEGSTAKFVRWVMVLGSGFALFCS